jgi:hypothetical protein
MRDNLTHIHNNVMKIGIWDRHFIVNVTTTHINVSFQSISATKLCPTIITGKFH